MAKRVIQPYEINERYIMFQLLEPYFQFKYLTIPWLHDLSETKVEYSVFRKYLGYLREAPNRYLVCPERQSASPNADRKTPVYQLGQHGLRKLVSRSIVSERQQQDGGRSSPISNRPPLRSIARILTTMRQSSTSAILPHCTISHEAIPIFG